MRYFVVDLKQKYGIPKKIRETIYCTALLHNVTYLYVDLSLKKFNSSKI